MKVTFTYTVSVDVEVPKDKIEEIKEIEPGDARVEKYIHLAHKYGVCPFTYLPNNFDGAISSVVCSE